MKTIKPDYVSRKYPYTTLMREEFYYHRHSFWEIILCANGKAVHLINENKYEFKSGDIIVMKPGCTHNYKIYGNDYLHYDFYATSSDMKKACDNLKKGWYEELSQDLAPVCFSVEPPVAEMLKYKLNQLNSIQMTESYHKLSENTYFMLLNFICGIMIENLLNARNDIPSWMSALMSEMSKPEMLCAKLSRLVATTNYSHGHLCKLFKKHTGKTMTEYFTQLKMDYANVLLRSRRLNILEISLTLGYDSLSHFIQTFKKYNGTTPKAYRKILYADSNTDN